MNSPLTAVLSPKARAYLYAVVFVLGLVFTAVQAADGNWLEAAASLIASLTSALAGSNISEE